MLALILLSLSVVQSSARITSFSILALASDEDSQGEDEDQTTRDEDDKEDDGNNNDDDIDLDELNLLQICCAWSEKISDGIFEYRISDDGNKDSKQSVRNAIQDWDLLIDNR
jgi:hypothetical protein